MPRSLVPASLRRPPIHRTGWRAPRLDGLQATLALPAIGRAAAPPPARVGAWTLGGEIGRGGSSVVYAARASDPVAPPVALKLAHHADGPDFGAEADVLRRFAHPAVVRLREAGTHTDGRPYLVLDRVPGAPVCVHARRLTPRQRVGLFVRLCRAVAVLHRRGVIHGDLKPGNVFVRPDGRVVLLDFGSALRLGAPAPTGRRPLTPEFAAPEQIVGDPMSAATDVYALGLLLHELLCGRQRRLPWALGGGRETVFDSLAWDDVAADVVRAPPVRCRVLARSGRARATLDGATEAVLETALRTHPSDRFASASHLAEAVAALLPPAERAADPFALPFAPLAPAL